jgi:hypothetical protein
MCAREFGVCQSRGRSTLRLGMSNGSKLVYRQGVQRQQPRAARRAECLRGRTHGQRCVRPFLFDNPRIVDDGASGQNLNCGRVSCVGSNLDTRVVLGAEQVCVTVNGAPQVCRVSRIILPLRRTAGQPQGSIQGYPNPGISLEFPLPISWLFLQKTFPAL